MFFNVKIPPSADETVTTAAFMLMSSAAAIAHSHFFLFVCFQHNEKRTPTGYSVLRSTENTLDGSSAGWKCPDFRCEVSAVQQDYKITI